MEHDECSVNGRVTTLTPLYKYLTWWRSQAQSSMRVRAHLCENTLRVVGIGLWVKDHNLLVKQEKQAQEDLLYIVVTTVNTS